MNLQAEPKLGVLGGMGPQATQVFYQYVLDHTDASCDQEHLPTLILSDTLMPDRTKSILSGNTGPVYERLLRDAQLLENCGCTAIAIPCNTSHYFVDRLQENISTPIIHMIRETANYLFQQGKRRPGILATDGTIQSGLYQKECAAVGLEAVAPAPDINWDEDDYDDPYDNPYDDWGDVSDDWDDDFYEDWEEDNNSDIGMEDIYGDDVGFRVVDILNQRGETTR